MNSEKYKQALKEATMHLQFCCSVYQWQLSREKHFLHEHPFGARSWKHRCIQNLKAHPLVEVYCGDQCVFGQMVSVKGADGGTVWHHARKRTGWMTDLKELGQALARKCDGRW